MEPRQFDVCVVQHKKVETEGSTKFTVKLQSPSGHYVVLKSESADIYEGLPLKHSVTVKIVDLQTTLTEGE